MEQQLKVLKVAKEVIPRLEEQFSGSDAENGMEEEMMLMMGDGHNRIHYIAGTILVSEVERFRRLVFRSTKGNSYVYSQEAEEPNEQGKSEAVYIIVFWGGEHIQSKIERICDSFSGNRFELPPSDALEAKEQELKEQLETALNLVESTRSQLREQLQQFNRGDAAEEDPPSALILYKMFIAKEKALYKNLNMLRAQHQSLIGFFWAPVERENDIIARVEATKATKCEPYDSHFIPKPTYFKTNDFCWFF